VKIHTRWRWSLSLQIVWILGQVYIRGFAHESVDFCTITNRKAVKIIIIVHVVNADFSAVCRPFSQNAIRLSWFPIMIQVIRLVYVGVVKQRHVAHDCASKLPESGDYGRTYKSCLAIDHWWLTMIHDCPLRPTKLSIEAHFTEYKKTRHSCSRALWSL